ncbi:MAG: hypothetical protein RL199_1593 [Pseudomonadota bacterium]
MRPDHRPVNDAAFFVGFNAKRLENLFPDSSEGPVAEAVVDGLPWSEPLWEVTPWDTGSRSVDDRIQERPVTQRRGGSPLLFGDYRLDLLPLFVCQRVSVHAPSY